MISLSRGEDGHSRFCIHKKEWIIWKEEGALGKGAFLHDLAEVLKPAQGGSDLNRPIVIPMEDDLLHTQKHPYCDDPACPCHTHKEEHTSANSGWNVQRKAKRENARSRRKGKRQFGS